MHLALDHRRIDDTFLWAADDAAHFRGTAATHDLDGVLPIGAEAQRPDSRVAATSAYTSPLLPPYLTFNSSLGSILQANFGVLPGSFLLSYLQVTVSRNLNALSPAGPLLRSLDGMFGGLPHRARAMAVARESLAAPRQRDCRGRDAGEQDEYKSPHENFHGRFSAISLP